jgi:hypothetical protein
LDAVKLSRVNQLFFGDNRRFLGENDMMAYLTMMANRLLQLHRVLKPEILRSYAT